jgi:alkylation response protein AidB-like acyl-CoA dehydrogenase
MPTSVLTDMQGLLRLGCIARALGAAGRSFELAVDHARTRQQFGSPIGHFQAVQHRLSDGAIALDASRLLLRRAAAARDSGEPRWRDAADAACAYAAPALRRVTRDAQHVLAGVGYMEEHEAPRHFRRVFADTVRFGGAAAARARLGAASLEAAAIPSGASDRGATG